MSRQSNLADSDYALNFRFMYYKCDKTEHNMRNCVKINMLINQKIIHQDDTNCLMWDKKNINDISVQLMHDLLWKNDIIKQLKNQEINFNTKW